MNNGWDTQINIFLQNLGTWLNLPMQLFSFLGTEEFFIFVMPALYWCLSPAVGLRTAMALVLSSSLNAGMKMVFHLPRPYWVDPAVKALSMESSFGLPSNHAQNAVLIWGSLAQGGRSPLWVVLSIVLAAFIGLSRLYLGVHFLPDVLAGWAIGGLLLWLLIRIERKVSAWISRQSLARLFGLAALGSMIVILAVVVPGLAAASWPVPASWGQNALAAAPGEPIDPFSLNPAFTLGGIWLGMFGGAAWLFRRSGGFQIHRKPLYLGLRYLLGLAGVVVLWFGLGQIFPREADFVSYLLRYLRYTLIGLWIALWAPLLFRRLRL